MLPTLPGRCLPCHRQVPLAGLADRVGLRALRLLSGHGKGWDLARFRRETRLLQQDGPKRVHTLS